LMVEEVEIWSKSEAQALSNFLWNEMERHMDDTEQIAEDLKALEENVTPRLRRVYVKP